MGLIPQHLRVSIHIIIRTIIIITTQMMKRVHLRHSPCEAEIDRLRVAGSELDSFYDF